MAEAIAEALARAGLETTRVERAVARLEGRGRVSAARPAEGSWRRRLALVVTGEIVAGALLLQSWDLLAGGALGGQVEPGWLVAWVLLLLTVIVIQNYVFEQVVAVSVAMGVALRERLMRGSLALDPDQVRAEGVGGLLGRVHASARLDELGIGGGLRAALAALELGLVLVLLGRLAPTLALLGLAAGITTLVLGAWTAVADRRAARHRRALCADLTEKMLGHRTRVIQAPPALWGAGEAEALRTNDEAQLEVDRRRLWLSPALNRSFRALGVLLVGARLLAEGPSAAGLLGLGLLLLASQALERLVSGVSACQRALVAAEELEPMWRAGRPVVAETNSAEGPAEGGPAEVGPAGVVLDMQGLGASWTGGRPVLDRVNLTIPADTKVLVQGPSGGGKSTLVFVIGGLLRPTEGVLLAGGLDQRVLGEGGWRRRVVLAPQFHHNHIFAETLLFNLLLGRAWPPSAEDHAEAEAVCVELGLGPLLSRMPAGLLQQVGEQGWQLSHGEKSRIFLARALLTHAPVVILDESFAALDAESLERCVETSRRRSRTLIVVAHP